MRNDLNARGPLNSPILIVGDSLPENKDTQLKLSEILDRRGVIYNSIIIPLKYYINNYLYNYRLKLPSENNNDIFRYVNAVDNPNDKSGLNPLDSAYSNKISKLRNEILDLNNNNKYSIIICMGDFSYFAVRTLFDKYYPREKKCYRKNGTKFTIRRLGEFFQNGIDQYKPGGDNILPILHNSSNLSFSKTDEFIPSQRKGTYKCYLQYVGEEIGKVMRKDEKIRSYLEAL